MKDRVILHCDMNGFYASCELLSRPDLRNVPMAVAGDPRDRRGIILAKNEIAKKAGVVTAETIARARRKCPGLVCVEAHMEKYRYYSGLINDIYRRYTDMIEPFSIDESWLDVTGSVMLFGNGKKIADEIRETVKSELGLTLSAGVSFNKTFAKMGSEYRKPDATTVIGRDDFKDILWSLPAGEFFFVGKATAEKLSSAGIMTIGDIAAADPVMLTALLGRSGYELHRRANGEDDSPVAFDHEKRKIKSVGNGVTFRHDLTDENEIRAAVTAIADRVSARLRKLELKASGVKVEIKDPTFRVISRQKQLEKATDLPGEIADAALEIIRKNRRRKDPVRLITITGIGIEGRRGPEQLSLFDIENEDRRRSEQIAKAMDEIRDRFGRDSISFGSVVGSDIGIHKKRGNDQEE